MSWEISCRAQRPGLSTSPAPVNNVLDRQRWRARHDLRLAIVTWIERTYHRRRPQERLGRLTPIQYEANITPAAPLAA